MSARLPRDAAGIVRTALVLLVAACMLEYFFAEWPWTLLDEGILAIHEAGHVIFRPFGEFLMMLGGSLFQLIVPVAFVAYFVRRRDHYAAAVVLFWLAASMFNLATYIADARAGELPLITGSRSDHDWTWLLIQLKALDYDVAIGRVVRFGGFLCYAGGIFFGLHHAVPHPASTEVRPEGEEAART